MRNKLLLITGSIILVLFFLISFSLIFSRPSQKNLPGITPPVTQSVPTSFTLSATPTQQLSTTPLAITNVSPENNHIGATIDQTVMITFSAPVNSTDIIFSITPSVPFTQSVTDNIVSITFTSPLAYNTSYTWMVSYNNQQSSQSFNFTTAAQNSSIYNDNANQQNADWTKKNRPDLYLYNQLQEPYTDTTNGFIATGDYTQTPTDHYFFTVTITSPNRDAAKNVFISWIKSYGLTDDQITSLDIRYQ